MNVAITILMTEMNITNLFKTKNDVCYKYIYRNDYAPRRPYSDHPQSIGYGATISAP